MNHDLSSVIVLLDTAIEKLQAIKQKSNPNFIQMRFKFPSNRTRQNRIQRQCDLMLAEILATERSWNDFN